MWVSDLPFKNNPNKIWIEDPVLTESEKEAFKKNIQDMADEIDKKIVDEFLVRLKAGEFDEKKN